MEIRMKILTLLIIIMFGCSDNQGVENGTAVFVRYDELGDTLEVVEVLKEDTTKIIGYQNGKLKNMITFENGHKNGPFFFKYDEFYKKGVWHSEGSFFEEKIYSLNDKLLTSQVVVLKNKDVNEVVSVFNLREWIGENFERKSPSLIFSKDSVKLDHEQLTNAFNEEPTHYTFLEVEDSNYDDLSPINIYQNKIPEFPYRNKFGIIRAVFEGEEFDSSVVNFYIPSNLSSCNLCNSEDVK